MAFDKYRDDRICPIVNKTISANDCFDVHSVLGGAPEYVAPKEIIDVKDYAERCSSCPFHIKE